LLLAIDASTRLASIALYDGRLLAEVTWMAGTDHSQQLLPRVESALSSLGRTVADVTAIGVAIGPGSFNGLRIGVSTAKAIALATSVPIVGVETLYATAYAYRLTDKPIRPLYDAGHGEVATGLYQSSGDLFATLEEPRLMPLDDAIAVSPVGTIFCGEPRPEWIDRIDEVCRRTTGQPATVTRSAEGTRRAGYLAELAWQRVTNGVVDDVATLQPLYLRRPPISGIATAAVGGAAR
jgi:tRNA threonylcarbamoyladenosine biosynthesis protein TsaB